MMVESEEILGLQNRLDAIVGVKSVPKRRRVHRHIRLTEKNIKKLFNMTMKELLFALCRELGYVVLKKKSGIEIIS